MVTGLDSLSLEVLMMIAEQLEENELIAFRSCSRTLHSAAWLPFRDLFDAVTCTPNASAIVKFSRLTAHKEIQSAITTLVLQEEPWVDKRDYMFTVRGIQRRITPVLLQRSLSRLPNCNTIVFEDTRDRLSYMDNKKKELLGALLCHDKSCAPEYRLAMLARYWFWSVLGAAHQAGLALTRLEHHHSSLPLLCLQDQFVPKLANADISFCTLTTLRLSFDANICSKNHTAARRFFSAFPNLGALHLRLEMLDEGEGGTYCLAAPLAFAAATHQLTELEELALRFPRHRGIAETFFRLCELNQNTLQRLQIYDVSYDVRVHSKRDLRLWLYTLMYETPNLRRLELAACVPYEHKRWLKLDTRRDTSRAQWIRTIQAMLSRLQNVKSEPIAPYLIADTSPEF